MAWKKNLVRRIISRGEVSVEKDYLEGKEFHVGKISARESPLEEMMLGCNLSREEIAPREKYTYKENLLEGRSSHEDNYLRKG